MNKKIDNEVLPWWTTSLGPSLKWVGSFINSAKEFGKYMNIPHSEIKLHKIMLKSKKKTSPLDSWHRITQK
jgi:hypothetical protein